MLHILHKILVHIYQFTIMIILKNLLKGLVVGMMVILVAVLLVQYSTFITSIDIVCHYKHCINASTDYIGVVALFTYPVQTVSPDQFSSLLSVSDSEWVNMRPSNFIVPLLPLPLPLLACIVLYRPTHTSIVQYLQCQQQAYSISTLFVQPTVKLFYTSGTHNYAGSKHLNSALLITENANKFLNKNIIATNQMCQLRQSVCTLVQKPVLGRHAWTCPGIYKTTVVP